MHANTPGGINDILGALEMNSLKRSAATGIFADDADEVDHGLATGHGLIKEGRVEKFAAGDADVFVRRDLQIPAMHQGRDGVSARKEFLHDRRSDESAGAGDEDALKRLGFHRAQQ